jgi:ferredoxin
VSQRLEIDPIACDGHGLCAELLPELVDLDEWGYPVVVEAEVPRRLAAHAKRAVAACPVLALKLRAASSPTGAFTAGDPGRRRTGLAAARMMRVEPGRGSMQEVSNHRRMK